MTRGYLLLVFLLGLAVSAPVAMGGPGIVVSGALKYNGTVPPPRKVPIAKDPEVCGTGDRVIHDIRVTQDGLLADTVVCLDGNVGGASFAKPEGGYTMDQEGCRFLPFLQIIPRAEALTITNRDPVLHNIHAYEVMKQKPTKLRRDLFNFAQPGQGHQRTEKIQPRTKTSTVELNCDAHDFMQGWIYVADSPLCTVVENGTFKINGASAGEVTVKAWHPLLGIQEQKVTLEAGKETKVTFVFEGR